MYIEQIISTKQNDNGQIFFLSGNNNIICNADLVVIYKRFQVSNL